jgi:hypothetical protein
MTYYTVVTRKRRVPVSERFLTIESAATYIIHKRSFHREAVLAQDGSKSAPFRELHRGEQRKLEAKLYPTLFED